MTKEVERQIGVPAQAPLCLFLFKINLGNIIVYFSFVTPLIAVIFPKP